MQILGLIPARGDSKGVPGKNNKLLNGTPLIGYTIASGLESQRISKLVVSTDDPAIAQTSKDFGSEVPFLRPAALATDHSPSIDTVLHALSYFSEKGIHFDAVCLLQPTVPFRPAGSIDSAIQKFEESEADSLISVQAVPDKYNPHWTFLEQENSPHLQLATGEQQIVSRRQELPKAYYRDGSIYLTRTEVLIQNRSLYGKTITYLENTDTPLINIDTAEDWLKAEKQAARHGG